MITGYTVFAGVRKDADKAPVIAHCKATRGADACNGLIPIIIDVTKPEHIEQVYAEISAWTQANKQPFVALVNNAGIAPVGPVEVVPLDTYRKGLWYSL